MKQTAFKNYIVERGDTLSSIAEAMYGDFKQTNYIAAVNGLANPNNLKVGQVLIIPALSSYATVQPTMQTNFAANPRAAADTLISQVETEGVSPPMMTTALGSPTLIPSPDATDARQVTYEAGAGGDLGTVTASATSLAPKWLTVVLIAAGLYILLKE